MDLDFLKALTEAPSVATACGPVVRLLTRWFGDRYSRTLVPDAFCLFQKGSGQPGDLRIVFVAHLDEIGGCVHGSRDPAAGGGFYARYWGNAAEVFAQAALQAFDYNADDPASAFPITAEVVGGPQEKRQNGHAELIVRGQRIRAYRTAWTFREHTTFEDDTIEGKALDPRVTVYAVAEAVRALDATSVGALYVMAEECAVDMARKAVTFLMRNVPGLRTVVNADVPWIGNIDSGTLDWPAIRIFEGRNFIDPSFGIRAADRLQARGVEVMLSAARTGSQTALFTPLARTLSIALPSDGVHLPRVKMSLRGTRRCVELLQAIGEHEADWD